MDRVIMALMIAALFAALGLTAERHDAIKQDIKQLRQDLKALRRVAGEDRCTCPCTEEAKP